MDYLKIEVDRFIVFLKTMEETLVGYSMSNEDEDKCKSFEVEIIDRNEAEAIFKAMKSNVTIMLYNYVEANVRKTMSDFYSNFNSISYSYSEVVLEIKKMWIASRAKKLKESNMVEDILNIIEDSIDQEYHVALDFDKDFSLSGNADVRTIKSILSKHGVSYNEAIFSDYGGSLKSIKDMRNSLAHGNISFEENGKNLTVSDIVKYKGHVYECIDKFCDLVNLHSF